MKCIDNKTFATLIITVLLAVFGSSATSIGTFNEKMSEERSINAAQQIEINELKSTVKSIKENTDETHDNVIIIMTTYGLTPINSKK